jgi:nucleoside-diphosphate-sugar epimerase
MQTAFVTGGSGFVGRELIRALREKGVAVQALARSDGAAATVEKLGATAVRGDLTDRQALARGVAGCDTVFHAAAYVEDWGPREDFFRTNVEATRLLVEAAERAKVASFVFIGTEASLADGKPIVQADEKRPYAKHPAGLYPLTKGLAETIVLEAARDGFRTMSVRPRLVWGRGDTSLLPKFVDAAKSGKLAWIGGGTHLSSSCHVRNLAHAALLCAERGKGGEAYFVTDGENRPLKDFIGAMLKTQGIEPTTKTVPRWAAALVARLAETWARLTGGHPTVNRTVVALMGVEVTVVDEKARRELGYAPIITVDEGLREMS